MNLIEFLNGLRAQGWVLENNITVVNVDNLANWKFEKADIEFKKFVNLFSSCHNQEDNIWFLSKNDYEGESDSAFSWDEFENQSIEATDDKDIIEAIREFCKVNLPFMMAVKNGYAYAAIVLDGPNKGAVIVGNEPEYEDSTIVAKSLNDFWSLSFST